MLFSKIVDEIGRTANYCVRFPGSEFDPTGGKGKFGSWLAAASEIENFKANIKTVLLVADADEDRDATFKEIKTLLERNGFAAPDAERQLVKALAPNCPFVPFSPGGAEEPMCNIFLVEKVMPREQFEHMFGEISDQQVH